MSSHLGIVILIIVGLVTVFSVIIIAAIEARRIDKSKTSLPPSVEQNKRDKT